MFRLEAINTVVQIHGSLPPVSKPKHSSWLALSDRFYGRSRRVVNSTAQAPRKRPRTSSAPVTVEPSISQDDRTKTLIRDEEFYRDEAEGMCIFRVGDVLFKVHRFLLSRDCSAFSNMFRLPRGDEHSQSEGSSDQNPVFLSGDTTEQFRALLWVLYALPSELQHVPIERLINIAIITHKYHFESIESWAIEELFIAVRRYHLHTMSADIYARVLEVAILCEHAQLRDVLIEDSISRILWYGLSPEPLLAVAERHGLRKLQGVAYYRQLTQLDRTAINTNSGTSRLQFGPAFSMEQRFRLLSGYQSLVRLWEFLRQSPPDFSSPSPPSCQDHSKCISTWREKWIQVGKAEETLSHAAVDLLGRLSCMDDRLRMELVFEKSMTLQCTLAGFEAVSQTIHEIIENLSEHFVNVV